MAIPRKPSSSGIRVLDGFAGRNLNLGIMCRIYGEVESSTAMYQNITSEEGLHNEQSCGMSLVSAIRFRIGIQRWTRE
jgi:hypothetical protein